MKKLLGLLCFSLAACAPPADERGWVLLDEDARREGLELAQDGWRGAPVLPIELAAGSSVELDGPAGVVVVRVTGGQLAWIHGSGTIEQVRSAPDVLIVDGDETVARSLASFVEGTTTPRSDGTYTLASTDLMTKLSFAEAPDGLHAVAPVDPRAASPPERAPSRAAPTTLGLHAGDAIAINRGSELAAAWVGLHVRAEGSIFVEAEGAYTIFGCDGTESHGTVEERDGEPILVDANGDTVQSSLLAVLR